VQIIYAAKSRSTYNVELKKIEELGPFNVAKAFMVRTYAQGSLVAAAIA